MNSVGVISAKGSSTRLANKNKLLIGDRPIFLNAAYNLEKYFFKENIYLDSDDDYILSMAKEHGFSTIKRSVDLTTDATCGNSLLLNVAEKVYSDIYVHYSAPLVFLWKDTITKAVQAIYDGYDSAFTVRKERLYRWSKTGPLYESRNNRLPSTSELEDSILETTQLYAVSRESLLSHQKRVCGKFMMIEVDRYQSIDIDYPEDLIFANTVFNGLKADEEHS